MGGVNWILPVTSRGIAPTIFSFIYQEVSGKNGGDRSPKEKSHYCAQGKGGGGKVHRLLHRSKLYSNYVS